MIANFLVTATNGPLLILAALTPLFCWLGWREHVDRRRDEREFAGCDESWARFGRAIESSDGEAWR